MSDRFAPFQSTLWSVIHSAGRGDRSSFDDFVRTYRRPLASYLQARGVPEHDAEDLVQEVFIRIFEKGLLARLSAEGGRFRSFLLVVARNVLGEIRRHGSAQKRGGEGPRISLDGMGFEGTAAEPDEEFDRLWVQNLIQVAFERLKAAPSEEGPPHVELLKAYADGDETYGKLAAQWKMTETQVRSALVSARKRLRKLVLQLMGEYVLSEDEMEEERRFISRYLK